MTTHPGMERLAATARENPLALFMPSPALRPYMADDHRRILVRAANRVGKTKHLVAKLCRRMIATPNRRTRASGPTAKQAAEVLSRYLLDLLPRSLLAPDCRYTPGVGWNRALVRLTNGSTCQIRSYDQHPQAHAGDRLDHALLDEVPPPQIWMETQARVFDSNGTIDVGFTPVGRPVGWFRKIVEGGGDRWHEYVVPLTFANCPWYTQVQIDRWFAEAGASPWERNQRLLGDWDGPNEERELSGFNDSCITDDAADQWPAGAPVHVGLSADHGEKAGRTVWLVWGHQPGGGSRIMGEYVSETATNEEQDAIGVRDELSTLGLTLRHVDWAVGDHNTSGKSRGGQKLNAIYTRLFAKLCGGREAFVVVPARKGPGSIDYGLRLLNGAFIGRDLKVSRRCVKTIRAFSSWGGGSDEFEHFVDTGRYGITELAVRDDRPTFRLGGAF